MKKVRFFIFSILAFPALLTASAQCPQEVIDDAMKTTIDDWNFSKTNYTDPNSELGYRYDLDTTNKVARWNTYSNYSKFTEDGSIVIPEAIMYNDEWYVVVSVDNPNGYSSTSKATSITFPNTLRYIGNMAMAHFDYIDEFDIPGSVEKIGKNAFYTASGDHEISLFMHGNTVPLTEGRLDSSYCSHQDSNNKNEVNFITVYVPGDLFDDYIYADNWENTVIVNADKYDVDDAKTEWLVLDRVDEGQLGYAVVADNLPADVRRYAEVNCLKVLSGSLNKDDWYAIRQMKNLVKLDLSGTNITEVPEYATRYCWQIGEIILPNTVEKIGTYAFSSTGVGKYSEYAPDATGEGTHDFHMPTALKTVNSGAFYNCDHLRNVYIPDGVTNITSDCFGSCDHLNRADLPATLTNIASGAFYDCDLIKHTVPGGVKKIGYSAYASNSNLTDLTLEEGIETIDSYAFETCTKLDNVTTPTSLRTIESYAFQSCKALKNLNLKEGLQTISTYSFLNCTSLEEITLPSTLLNLYDYSLYGCTNLQRINSKALIPPTLRGHVPTNENNSTIQLFVPEWSVASYMTTPGWVTYQKNTEAGDIWPEYLYVRKDFQLLFKNNQPADYHPDLLLMQDDQTKDDGYGHTMMERGNLTIGSQTGLHLKNFEMTLSPWAKYDRDYDNMTTYCDYESSYDKYRPTSLVVHGSISTENATVHYQMRRDTWHAVYFNNVAFEDFVADDPETQFVIKRYDAQQRAAGNMELAWQNVTDGLLNGCYFVKCYNSSSQYSNAPIGFTAKVGIDENVFSLLTNGTGTPQIECAPSTDDKDASWNLISVERPCFYDSRYMSMTDSKGNNYYNFLVWNAYNRKYQAYSTRDDKYVISPAEAFFVQGPNSSTNMLSVTFDDRGRQYRANSRELDYYSSNARRVANENDARLIFNIIAASGTDSDRTRIVLNENASTGYDAGVDMYEMKSDENVLLLWTRQGDSELAINERPLGDGEVSLGLGVGQSGHHSFRLAPADFEAASTEEYDVYIEDIDEGSLNLISEEQAYNFYAEQGEYPGRFYVHFVTKNNPTAIESIKEVASARHAARFNLAGQRAGSDANGIIIENGKKVIR